MQLPAPAVLASWPQGNFEHPSEERGLGIVYMVTGFLPLVIAVVAARLYSRIHIVKDFGIDDGFILAALLPAVGLAFTAIYSTTQLGWRMHIWNLVSRPDLVVSGLQFVMAVQIQFALCTSFTKISMLLFTRRIIGPGSPKLRLATDLNLLIITIDAILFVFISIFTCRPVSAYWVLSFEPQKCINQTAHLLAASVINLVTEVWTVLLPIPLAMSLQIPPRQKVTLVLLFGSGFITCAAGMLRTYYTYLFATTYDRTWMAFPLWTTIIVEVYLGLITASLPGLKPLISRFAPGILERKKASKAYIESDPEIAEPSSKDFHSCLPRNPNRIVHFSKRNSTPTKDQSFQRQRLEKTRPVTRSQDLPKIVLPAKNQKPRHRLSKPLPPLPPSARNPRRPSFYTAKYGSMRSPLDTHSRDARPMIKVDVSIDTYLTPRNETFAPQNYSKPLDSNRFIGGVFPYSTHTHAYSPRSPTRSHAERRDMAIHKSEGGTVEGSSGEFSRHVRCETCGCG